MKKAYLDVNVVFDFLLERKPFYIEASQIFELSRLGKISLTTDTQTIVFAFFHLTKLDKDRRRVKDKLLKLLNYMEVANLSEAGLRKALEADYPIDLEDAGQLEIAQEAKVDVFITRDLKDYKDVNLPVFSPAYFLTEFSKL